MAAAARAASVGRSYAIESAGAAAGGAAVTLAMGLGASTFQVALLAPGTRRRRRDRLRRRWPRRRRLALPFAAVLRRVAWRRRRRRSRGTWHCCAGCIPSLVDAERHAVRARRRGRAATPRWRCSRTARSRSTPRARAPRRLPTSPPCSTRARARALVIGGGGEGVPDALGASRPSGRLTTSRSTSAPRPRACAHRHRRRGRAAAGAPRRGVLRGAAAVSPARRSVRPHPRRGRGADLRRVEPLLHRRVLRAVRAAADPRRRGRHPPGRRRERLARPPRAAHGQRRRGASGSRSAPSNLWPARPSTFSRRTATSAADPAVLSARLLGRGLRPRLITPPYLRLPLYERPERRGGQAVPATSSPWRRTVTPRRSATSTRP